MGASTNGIVNEIACDLTLPPAALLPGFADCGRLDPGFLRLMLRTLRIEFPNLERELTGIDRVRRFAGDLANGGKGELLFWE